MYGTRLFDVDEVPTELLDCFEEVETQCGAPWERVTEKEKTPTRPGNSSKYGPRDEQWRCSPSSDFHERMITTVTTLGWQPTCQCQAPVVPCTVLDPFNGAATVGIVALKHHRRYIGLELNPDYIALSHDRIRKSQPLLLEAI